MFVGVGNIGVVQSCLSENVNRLLVLLAYSLNDGLDQGVHNVNSCASKMGSGGGITQEDITVRKQCSTALELSIFRPACVNNSKMRTIPCYRPADNSFRVQQTLHLNTPERSESASWTNKAHNLIYEAYRRIDLPLPHPAGKHGECPLVEHVG